jgi:hypothetical protein
MLIPRALIPELDGVSPAIIGSVSVSPAGDALAWRCAPMSISTFPGWWNGAFGTRVFAASNGRRGGHRKSKGKKPLPREQMGREVDGRESRSPL